MALYPWVTHLFGAFAELNRADQRLAQELRWDVNAIMAVDRDDAHWEFIKERPSATAVASDLKHIIFILIKHVPNDYALFLRNSSRTSE